MGSHANNPMVAVRPETKARLDAIGKKGDTYDIIITRLLDGRVHIPLKERHAKAKRIIGTAVTATQNILR